MKAYKVVLLVIDDENVGEKNITSYIEDARYPNRCIAPQVMAIDGREIGDWHDDHPLNKTDQYENEFKRLFDK